MKKYYAKNILLSDGWATDKTLTIANGIIIAITSGQDHEAEVFQGAVIPGMINCHSHAFQRAFAGFSEQGSEGKDSFWTWRTIMYKFLAQLTPEDTEIIAQQLYIEMLKVGYTRVAEFHYLHHDIDGHSHSKNQSQAKLAIMAQAIFNAAQHSGIGLTLLPVLYQYSGFGQQTPTEGQKRFINSTTQFNQLISDCYELSQEYPNSNIGIAPHSLRAVDKEAMTIAVDHVRSLDAKAPIHIHISEQQQEVNDCLNYYTKRPVEWLINNMKIDESWCLIHATHINEKEQQGIIDHNAVVGICPTTEANLGDGIFPTTDFLALGGSFAIGSDSHISVSPIEELRWLEYTQRLIKQQRALITSTNVASVGQSLWQKSAASGAQSTNSNTGVLSIGKQADLLVIDDNKTALFANKNQYLLDSIIFASQHNTIKDVMVNGSWVVLDGRHPKEQVSADKFAQLLTKLSA
ncbi:formimidoylglutamate deiminase [Colwellia sp. 6_MG-2023]|uniref:formimidoylglutamate deiminase n=1 Tax=Colwellia sp. 6_MG-2023 TaxID=3062676 RepID=UPI0026E3A5A7|nr:formimidoylglutamate deiminase [Colwellia sp. 6_MG-2023]MDO6486378.1 formimidoylglutamate deiminase [Colwellia sp. 6_MG-2023]